MVSQFVKCVFVINFLNRSTDKRTFKQHEKTQTKKIERCFSSPIISGFLLVISLLNWNAKKKFFLNVTLRGLLYVHGTIGYILKRLQWKFVLSCPSTFVCTVVSNHVHAQLLPTSSYFCLSLLAPLWFMRYVWQFLRPPCSLSSTWCAFSSNYETGSTFRFENMIQFWATKSLLASCVF